MVKLRSLAALVLASGVAFFATADAAPGDAFDPNAPVVFVSKGEPPNITLFRQVVDGVGFADYDAEGGASASDYNALAFNLDNNYLYAITNEAVAGIPDGSVIRIGREGAITRVGTSTFLPSVFNPANTPAIVDQGAYNPDDDLLYVLQSSGDKVVRINPATGAEASRTNLSQSITAAGGGFDIAYSGGFFWSLNANTIVRLNPTSGNVAAFTVPGARTDTGPAGAAWTFGNGNLGFSHNTTGTITQITVTNPSGTPSFVLVSQTPGRPSSRNDGTNVPGAPADLKIVKTAALSDDYESVTYSLVVTNNGAGASSGWVVTDTLPAGLSNIQVTTAGASSVEGSKVTVRGGPLASGASATITISADLAGPLNTSISNTASVLGNEVDPVASNNQSTATLDPPNPKLALTKRVDSIKDVNKNGLVDVGDEISWGFDAANTGNVKLTELIIDDPRAGDVTCESETLNPAATTKCVVDDPYVITAADAQKGEVLNTAVATATAPDGEEVESPPAMAKAVVGVPVPTTTSTTSSTTIAAPSTVTTRPLPSSTSLAAGALPKTGARNSSVLTLVALVMLGVGGLLVRRSHQSRA